MAQTRSKKLNFIEFNQDYLIKNRINALMKLNMNILLNYYVLCIISFMGLRFATLFSSTSNFFSVFHLVKLVILTTMTLGIQYWLNHTNKCTSSNSTTTQLIWCIISYVTVSISFLQYLSSKLLKLM